MYVTKKHSYSECCKKVVCRPEIGPKHFDILRSEPGETYNSVLMYTVEILFPNSGAFSLQDSAVIHMFQWAM